jgi:hypothetical protein
MVKKIGNDSVVLITIKQGDEINKQFEIKENQISKLRDSLFNSKLEINNATEKYREILLKNERIKLSIDSINQSYFKEKIIFNERERAHKREQKLFAINGSVLVLLCLFLAWL